MHKLCVIFIHHFFLIRHPIIGCNKLPMYYGRCPVVSTDDFFNKFIHRRRRREKAMQLCLQHRYDYTFIRIFCFFFWIKYSSGLQSKLDAVGDGRLRFGAATSRTGRHILVVFDAGPFAPLCETATLSTNLEVHVHNVSYYIILSVADR